MGAAGGEERLDAGVGENGVQAAAVGLAALAGDQAVADEPVDDAGDAAHGQEDGVGELVHPQPASGRAVEVEQHLVRAERETVLELELSVELANEVGVHAQQSAPGSKLDGVQRFDRRLTLQVNSLTRQTTYHRTRSR